MIRAIIADDHKIMREGLAELLGEIPHLKVVGTATDGAEALVLVKAASPDLVILDLSMPVLDGFKVLEAIEKMGKRCKIIVLSMHKDPRTIQKALKAGADGYVLKEEAFETLADGIEAVMVGQPFVSTGAAAAISSVSEESEDPLSPREAEIAAMIARGLTSKEIATELGISVKTVDNHRQNIMEKLKVHKVTEIVRYVIGKGS